MKFFIKDFFSKCDQIRSFLLIWSHLLKKSFMGNFFFFRNVFILVSQLNGKVTESLPSEKVAWRCSVKGVLGKLVKFTGKGLCRSL